jgi:hypothetical protein
MCLFASLDPIEDAVVEDASMETGRRGLGGAFLLLGMGVRR